MVPVNVYWGQPIYKLSSLANKLCDYSVNSIGLLCLVVIALFFQWLQFVNTFDGATELDQDISSWRIIKRK